MQESMMDRLRHAAGKFWDESVLGNTPDLGHAAAPMHAANEMAAVHGLHNILKYDQYDPELGCSTTTIRFRFASK